MFFPLHRNLSYSGRKGAQLDEEGAFLINIGRGKTIDEKALKEALQIKKIQAVLDVFEREPLSPKSGLWDLKNVIITPHVSASTFPRR